MSENRSLAVLEILVHLSDVLPDKYVLGAADLPADVWPEVLTDRELPNNWATLVIGEQHGTPQLGDEWLRRQSSVVLAVPSVTSGERNFLLNPEHPQFRQINFHDPVPFRFDIRYWGFGWTRASPQSGPRNEICGSFRMFPSTGSVGKKLRRRQSRLLWPLGRGIRSGDYTTWLSQA